MKATNDHFDTALAQWNALSLEQDPYDASIIKRLLFLSKTIESSRLYKSDIEALATLYVSGKPYQVPPSQLMASVNLTSGATTALINRLHKNGWISRVADQNDLRVNLVKLTKEGLEQAKFMTASQCEHANQTLDVLDDLEKRQLGHLLRKVLQHMK